MVDKGHIRLSFSSQVKDLNLGSVNCALKNSWYQTIAKEMRKGDVSILPRTVRCRMQMNHCSFIDWKSIQSFYIILKNFTEKWSSIGQN